MGSGPRNAAALDDGASARAELACAGLVLLSLQVLLDKRQILFVDVVQEIRHILLRDFDNTLPSEEGSMSFARLQVVDVAVFRKQVFAKYVSPNLREISAEFMGENPQDHVHD